MSGASAHELPEIIMHQRLEIERPILRLVRKMNDGSDSPAADLLAFEPLIHRLIAHADMGRKFAHIENIIVDVLGQTPLEQGMQTTKVPCFWWLTALGLRVRIEVEAQVVEIAVLHRVVSGEG